MSKIFRLHKGGSDSITDWTAINGHLSESFINTIDDPAGENAKKQITSIPSPFARIDLVSTAFRRIANSQKVDGKTIHHRLISDSLDIAEIFFNAEALKNKIEIITWNPGISLMGNQISIDENSDLGNLLNSPNAKHRLLGETLKLFLIQDSETYNFKDLKRIYLLNYVGENAPDEINIIGGTSPASLFFSTSNEGLSDYVDIQFGSDRPFDNVYCPLYKRSDDFIRYFFALRRSFSQFPNRFSGIDDYMTLTYNLLSPSLKEEIRNFTPAFYSQNYKDIAIGGNENFNPEILGHPLKGIRIGIVRSDFEIETSKPQNGVIPFVLPNDSFNEQLTYVNGPWKTEYKAPFFDVRPLQERTLPHQDHVLHPYLTVSDLLEPFIIRLPYPINKDKYFNGNLDSDTFGYALPIKKEFFKYFSIQDLQSTVSDGKKRFELIQKAADSIEAILRIPIQNDKYIQFSRLYITSQFQDRIQQPSLERNKGVIVEYQFGITIYPFLKTGSDIGANYRILLIDRDTNPLTKYNEYQLAFYKESAISDPIVKVNENKRSNKHNANDVATSLYYVIDKEFDVIELKPNSTNTGLLIPLLKTANSGASQFSFAIDFGTTNTHIEYKIDNGNPKPFEITDSDIQLGSLHYNTRETDILLRDIRLGIGAHNITELISKEFLPEKIGKEFEYNFPMRTVITENKALKVDIPTYTLADYNIPFVYEKTDLPPNFKLSSNLKWSDFDVATNNKRRVEAFIEKLLILIRNKVLLNGGNLETTKIIWFYPSSMSEYRRDALENAWNKFSQKYISPVTTPYKLSESVAPFYYFRNKGGILAYDNPVASIDIGGGTTDIVIYKDNLPIFLTSFKFAANSVFGDGYGNSIANNGFIMKYYPIIKDKLSNAGLDKLLKALEQIKENDSSQELIAFFFSLESNRTIKDGSYPISFSEQLKEDKDFKLVFLFFYAAIIYHLAKLMKAKNLPCPRYITFSGTGSKIINLADRNKDLKNLTAYSKIIFEDVYEIGKVNIELRTYDDPKEITCKGGLLCDNYADIDDIKTVLVGSQETRLIPENSLKYNEIDDSKLLSSVESEVMDFIDKFFNWNEKYNYANKFGVNPQILDGYKDSLKEDLMQYLKAGVKEKQSEVQNNNKINIEETLFFYPLVGALNKFSHNIFSNVEI
jgi:hypothetical protein